MRNVRHSTLAPDQPPGPFILQMLVQHAVQPPRLVLIPVDAVLDVLRGVTGEVVGLALHGADAGVEEEEPGCHLWWEFISMSEGEGWKGIEGW